MNLKIYSMYDKLQGSIYYMSIARNKKELDEIFAKALQELIEYDLELKKEIGCEKLNCAPK